MRRQGWNLEELMETIWEYTNMIRIYTKVIVFEFINQSVPISYIYFCLCLSPRAKSPITAPPSCCTARAPRSRTFAIVCTRASWRSSSMLGSGDRPCATSRKR